MTASATDRANEDVLLRADEGGVTTLTLNRPDKFNSMTEDLIQRLLDTLEALRGDASCRVVVLTASGTRAFCTGHDLGEMAEPHDRAFFQESFRRSAELARAMLRLPQPIIAKVHGLSTAGGTLLVSAADMAVASREARFAANGITNGLFCSMPAVTLSRNVPRKQAFNMLFTGAFIDADQALEIGLVNQVVDKKGLDATVAELAAQIVAKPRHAVARGKAMFYEQLQMPVSDALDYAARLMTDDMESAEAKEGIRAFMEKRPPVWE